MQARKEGQKSHRVRKNGRSVELETARRKAKNQSRPKQVFMGVDKVTGLGLGWTRG